MQLSRDACDKHSLNSSSCSILAAVNTVRTGSRQTVEGRRRDWVAGGADKPGLVQLAAARVDTEVGGEAMRAEVWESLVGCLLLRRTRQNPYDRSGRVSLIESTAFNSYYLSRESDFSISKILRKLILRLTFEPCGSSSSFY